MRHSCKTGKDQGGGCRLEMYPRFKQGRYEGEVKQVKTRSKRVYPHPRRRQEQSPVRFARIQCRRKGPSEQGPIPDTVRSQLDTRHSTVNTDGNYLNDFSPGVVLVLLASAYDPIGGSRSRSRSPRLATESLRPLSGGEKRSGGIAPYALRSPGLLFSLGKGSGGPNCSVPNCNACGEGNGWP